MKTTRILTCIFSAEEMKKLGIELAVANQHKESLEDSKKQAMSQYKAEIDAADATIKSLSQKLARGSEERKVECDVLFNTPEEGKKKNCPERYRRRNRHSAYDGKRNARPVH